MLGDLTRNVSRDNTVGMPGNATSGMQTLLEASPIALMGQKHSEHGQNVRNMVEKLYPER